MSDDRDDMAEWEKHLGPFSQDDPFCTMGSALWSARELGLDLEAVVSCAFVAETAEQFEVAVDATAWLMEMTGKRARKGKGEP